MSRSTRTFLWVGIMLGTLVACASPAIAQNESVSPTGTSSTESFAEAFFISRITHANGEKSIDYVGTTLLWVLLAMSMVNIGLIGYLALVNQRKSILPAGVVTELRKMLAASDFRRALELSRNDNSYFSRILHAGLNESTHGYSAMMRALEQSADLVATQRMRPIELLYMFGQISPMMGLLGTVYGIIFSFKVFVSMGGHASPALLASGIGTALVATFWGLVVAIPALAAYSILRNKVDQLTTEATVVAEEMLGQFKPKGAMPTPMAASAQLPQPVGMPRPGATPVLRPGPVASPNS